MSSRSGRFDIANGYGLTDSGVTLTGGCIKIGINLRTGPPMNLVNGLAAGGSFLASLILAALTGGVLYDVAMRDLFNAPTLWSVEYTSYGMAWLGLLCAAEVLRRDEHVGIRLVTDRLSPSRQRDFRRLSHTVVAATAGYLAYAGSLWALDAYRLNEVSDTVLQTPQVVVRLAFPVGMALVALVSLARMLADVAPARRHG